MIEATLSPSISFWLGVAIVSFHLAFIPIGVLAWLLGDSLKASDLIASIVIPIVAAMMTSWLWGTLVGVHYIYRTRCIREFKLLIECVAIQAPPVDE